MGQCDKMESIVYHKGIIWPTGSLFCCLSWFGQQEVCKLHVTTWETKETFCSQILITHQGDNNDFKIILLGSAVSQGCDEKDDFV